MGLTDGQKHYLNELVQKKVDLLEEERHNSITEIKGKFNELVKDRSKDDPLYQILLTKANSLVEQQKAKYDNALEDMYSMRSRFS